MTLLFLKGHFLLPYGLLLFLVLALLQIEAITVAIIVAVYYISDDDVVLPPVRSIAGPRKESNWRMNF
jgi:hypothetical protein